MNTQVTSTFANYNKLRKRKRLRLYKYLNPVKPEIKQWNCINGSLVEDKYDAITIMNIAQPSQPGASKGSWELIPFRWPSSGYYEDERIGKKFALKWILFRGYASVASDICFKCNYKLVLIKTQNTYADMHEFLNENFFNYQFPTNWTSGTHTFADVAERRTYGRHNFYKLFKNVTNQSEMKTSIKVLAAGTFTPDGGNPAPRFITTLGSNPAQSLEYAGLTASDAKSYAYYPINVKMTCNDNIDVSVDYYYLALLTDQPIGHKSVSTGSASTSAAIDYLFSFNFFTLGYYLDT